MDDQITSAHSESSAVRAFEDLRGEVSLLRRAIEGLAAERSEQPDYGPTLEALVASNEQIRDWARKVSERPGMQLTPLKISAEIEQATARFRQNDQQRLAAESARLADAIASVRSISQQALEGAEQVTRERIVGGLCFLSGALLWAILMSIEAG